MYMYIVLSSIIRKRLQSLTKVSPLSILYLNQCILLSLGLAIAMINPDVSQFKNSVGILRSQLIGPLTAFQYACIFMLLKRLSLQL